MCRIIVAIACLLSLSLRGEAQTATEVFQLRLASAELGQAILANNFIGTALTQDQVSHYIPRTNRCYVELTVRTGDVSKNLEYLNCVLYDRQTREMLAVARLEKGKKWGMVFDSSTAPRRWTMPAGTTPAQT